MRLARALTVIACSATVVAAACGGGSDGGTAPVDSSKVPTATLPAELPEAVIVGGGAVQPGGGSTYVVKSGDTLAGIAERFSLSLEELRAANPSLNPSALSVGDIVRLPALPEGVPTPAPTEPPPTPDPAVPTDTPVPPPPAPTDTPGPTNTPASLGQTYIVQSGDIPVTIAEKHGITVEALLAANPGIDPRGLQVGDVLIIPPPPPEGG